MENRCPECGCTNIHYKRIDYCYFDDTNPVICTCRRCGHTWEIRD